MGDGLRHDSSMDKGSRKITSPETKLLLAELRQTVTRLRHVSGDPPIEQWAKDIGCGYGTLHRLLTGGAGPTGETPPPNLEFLVRVAAYFGCHAWQLLVPGFDPAHPPKLERAERRAARTRTEA